MQKESFEKNIVRLDPEIQADPSSPTTVSVLYTDPGRTFRSGFYASDRCVQVMENYPKDELMSVLDGVIRIINRDGQVETFRSGDAFVIPIGFSGTWEVVEPIRIFFATNTPRNK